MNMSPDELRERLVTVEVNLQNLTEAHEDEKNATEKYRERLEGKLDKLMWMGAVATGILGAIQYFGLGK